MDAELKAKRDAQYDPRLEAEARKWIESVTGESLQGSFHEALKNGVVLCKYDIVVSKDDKDFMSFDQFPTLKHFFH